MRPRKRNPFYGQGLDKRQARRARRRQAQESIKVYFLPPDFPVVPSLLPPNALVMGGQLIETRPQDWAPPARAYLFGLDTLSPAEREYELARMSYGQRAYGEVRR